MASAKSDGTHRMIQKPQLAISTMQWSCRTCTLKNSVDRLVCDACGKGRHNIPEIEAVLIVEHRKTVAQVPAFKLSPVKNQAKALSDKDAISIKKPEIVQRKALQGLDNIKLTHEAQIIRGIQKSTTNFPKPRPETKDKASPSAFTDSWSCEACTLLNPLDAKTCSACLTLQPPQTLKNTVSSTLWTQDDKTVVSRRKSNDPRGPVRAGVKETFETILSTCGELDEEFVDDSFVPGPLALFVNGKGPAIINGQPVKFQVPHLWLRPSEISCNDPASRIANWSIMCDPTPSDIYQGSLGDCWLMGSLAMITERKELLDNILRTNEINQAGAYIVRLNHFGKWKDVIVDDLLPCDQSRRLIYAKAKRKQLWVPLIEKAMAKLHGSYEALIGGSNSESLTTLTGFPCNSISLVSSKLDFELTWAQLVSSASAGFLIGTGTHGRDRGKMLDNEKMGLKSRHAYSILEVNDEWGPKLIKLRNPWGKESWTGRWCSTSPLWTPEMKRALNRTGSSDKGTFWMCFEDFVNHFEVLDICRIRQNWEYNSFQGILLPYADRTSHPCYSMKVEKPTELDITLFQSSWLRRQKRLDSIVPDVALVLLKSSSTSNSDDSCDSSKWKLVQYTGRLKERDVNLNLMIDPGHYKLVPVSFGHWTSSDDNSDTFPEFEISIHSSRSISCYRVPSPPFVLADLIIKIGLNGCDVLKAGDQNIVLYHNQSNQSFGKGSLYIGENRHKDRWIAVEVDLGTSDNILSTRNLITVDCIPPNSRQVLNILTLKNHQLSFRLNFHLRTLSSRESSPNLRKFGYNGTHVPELTSNNVGLHTPRPII